jgi:hypothetical protein
MSLDTATTIRLGHLNLIDYCRTSTRWGKGGITAEADGILTYATASWIPIECNGAFREDDEVAADSVLEQAHSFFHPMGRGFSVKVREGDAIGRVDDDLRGACERAGLSPFGESSPEMIRRSPVDPPEIRDGIELRPVATAQGLADFAAVNDEAYATYGMPAGEVVKVFGRAPAFLASPHVHAVVAYEDAQPLAAALAFLSHGVAGIYWVGTVSNARRSGLGEAVAAATTNWTFEQGASACTLQASPMGEPIYERMGYESLYRYTNYALFRVPPD